MFLDFLKQPYPAISSYQIFTSAWVIGIFLALFIYFFEPFKLGYYPDYDLWLIAVVFGIITILTVSLFAVIYYLMELRGIQINGGTVLGEILVLYSQLGLLGFFNLVAGSYIFGFGFSLRALAVFHVYTIAVCAVPAIILFQYRYRYLVEDHTKSAKLFNQAKKEIPTAKSDKPEVVVIKSELKEKPLQIPMEQFLFASTADNYVDVFYKGDKEIVREMVRTNLSKIAEENPQLMRTHRSYLVNLEQVASASGNALGLKLTLPGVNNAVPVSRAYVPHLKPFLSKKLG